jgi:hypothetical protein
MFYSIVFGFFIISVFITADPGPTVNTGSNGAPPYNYYEYKSQQQQQQQQQHQKRSAIADPKTGIPMAAYPVTAFSYPSPSPLPIQFQQQYLTAVPMACKLFDHFLV